MLKYKKQDSIKENVMNEKKRIRNYYLKKFIGWFVIVSVLSVICAVYHGSPSARFHPLISAVIIAIIALMLAPGFELTKYIREGSFSGEIIGMKVYSKRYMNNAIEKKVERRAFVLMEVKCDNGKVIKFDQMLPKDEANTVPYRVGDRVYHIRGAMHVCRFPRGDTEKKYDPVSVVCPICGACNTLGSEKCAFCEIELPRDPKEK